MIYPTFRSFLEALVLEVENELREELVQREQTQEHKEPEPEWELRFTE